MNSITKEQADIIKRLKEYEINPIVSDSWADAKVAKHEYGVDVTNQLPAEGNYDTAILAVAHREFAGIDLKPLLKDNHVVFDVKGFLPRADVDARL